jgi:integrase
MIKVLLLTGQRRGEVAGMQWNEVRELGTTRAIWELPGDRTKNGQPHMVPLPNAVCEILNGLPRTGPFVFQGRITSAFSGFSKAKRQVDDEISVIRSRADLLPLSPWTLHDLRRTMVTVMNEELGIAPHVVEAVVNHVSGAAKRGVAGVYNRALYSLERRAALTQWSDWLLIAKQGAR